VLAFLRRFVLYIEGGIGRRLLESKQNMRTRLLFAALLAAAASTAAADTVNIAWTNARQVSVSGSSLSKSGGGAAWNAGASATQALASGDGYFQFAATAVDKLISAGFSQNDLSPDPADPLYSIQLTDTGSIAVVESGTSRGSFGSYAIGDVFKINVASSVVTYLKNGTTFYTSTVALKYPLQPDVSLYTQGGGVSSASLSGSLAQG
jgi:hypothetical protein